MVEVTLGEYHLEVATDFGPRIVGLRRGDGPETLARLEPDVSIEHEGGTYRFHGGHRLWASPEIPNVTYAGDEHECEVTVDDRSVIVTAPADDAGFAKMVTVTADGERLRVDHVLARELGTGDPVAAWAITQFPLGGVALLPLIGAETGALPNRQLTLWPYTSPIDDRLRLAGDGLEVTATEGSPIKLGFGPARPALGYMNQSQLFIKRHAASSQGTVPDFGAGSQVYVGQGFCELETVGGLGDGRLSDVSEIWEIVPCDGVDNAWDLLRDRSSG